MLKLTLNLMIAFSSLIGANAFASNSSINITLPANEYDADMRAYTFVKSLDTNLLAVLQNEGCSLEGGLSATITKKHGFYFTVKFGGARIYGNAKCHDPMTFTGTSPHYDVSWGGTDSSEYVIYAKMIGKPGLTTYRFKGIQRQ